MHSQNLEKLYALCLYIYVHCRAFFSLLWIRFCRWLGEPKRLIEKTSEYKHKIVIVGDGFAEGFGDAFVYFGHSGGISHYIKPLVAKEDKIKHQWQILNCGLTNSTSAQWAAAPVRMAAGKNDMSKEKSSPPSYFQSIFSQACYADADIVMIMVGSMDMTASMEVEETMAHLKLMCDAVRKKDKIVCLASVATTLGEEDENVLASQRKRNRLIQEYCASTNYDAIPVVLGPIVSSPMFRRPETRGFDGFHLNGRSYKSLAKNALDLLLPMMIKIEWKTWHDMLSRVEVDPALYND